MFVDSSVWQEIDLSGTDSALAEGRDVLIFKGSFAPTTALGGAIPTLTSAGHVPSNLFITLKAEALLISLAGVEHIAV